MLKSQRAGRSKIDGGSPPAGGSLAKANDGHTTMNSITTANIAKRLSVFRFNMNTSLPSGTTDCVEKLFRNETEDEADDTGPFHETPDDKHRGADVTELLGLTSNPAHRTHPD